MQKVIYGIFAHPDDEAFGVSPTLIKEVKNGTIVHLVTLTSGQNGTNPDNHEDLGTVRLEEWRHGGKLMGASSMHHFGYTDGLLSNNVLEEIAERITELVLRTIEAVPEVSIEFMSFDLGGLTGHIDHIVAARATCLAFYRLKERHPEQMNRIRLRCLPASAHPTANTDWIYMDAGKPPEEIDEIVDAREYYDTIIDVIRTHHSQRGDGETHIARYGNDIGLNYFVILK
jgi:LmbE family N-acetylglucosaminyl deacetylase